MSELNVALIIEFKSLEHNFVENKMENYFLKGTNDRDTPMQWRCDEHLGVLFRQKVLWIY